MTFEEYLSAISRNMGQAPRDEAVADSFYGLNIIGRGQQIPVNTENHGFTFFTRPAMNMTYDNLVVDRIMQSLLLENNPRSIQRSIRAYLDPNIQRAEDGALDCRHVDPHNPFIPLLSNNLVSLSGWPDFTLNTTTSSPGLYREEYSYVDDIPYSYGSYDLNATFRNIQGDPISFLLLIWGWYQGLVYEGRLMPYPEHVLLNMIDYNTRIYRLVTDASRTYVTRIGACGAAFPMTAPIGNIFNFEGDGSESPFTTANDQITVNFRCMGFTYYDYILIYEFNRVGELFNKAMRGSDQDREKMLVKLLPHEREFFNNRAYPRINEETMELEWWVWAEFYYNQRPDERIIR